jgi:cellulose synthase/poly-beta-1,6-N-acetylglucosamine synthase-like glycosyltransferase
MISPFWLLVALPAAASGYLATLAGLALLGRPKGPSSSPQLTRFAIVVPAHNEELLLPRLLESLNAQDYPRDRFQVHVIADNCSDATAAVARRYGAEAHERHDLANPGKGQAIAWLLPQLDEPAIDAFVFVDADSQVEPPFLSTLNDYLSAGYLALQASYRVAEAESAPLVTLRAMAFALMHELRGRAKARLGLSCGLWGNGIALKREVLEKVSWGSFSSVEDAEQHLKLVLSGINVRFVPETSVFGHMPGTLRSSEGQQQRWEAGRLALLRRYWRPLLGGAAKGNASAASSLIELALPPLSVLLAGEVLVAGIAAAFAPPAAKLAAVVALGGLGFYVVSGMLLSGLRPRSYLALAHAPGYVLWKVWLYARELVRRTDSAWTRTTRDSAS